MACIDSHHPALGTYSSDHGGQTLEYLSRNVVEASTEAALEIAVLSPSLMQQALSKGRALASHEKIQE